MYLQRISWEAFLLICLTYMVFFVQAGLIESNQKFQQLEEILNSTTSVPYKKQNPYIQQPHKRDAQRPSLIDIALQTSAREGLEAVAKLYGQIVPDIIRNGQLLAEDHPASLLSKFSAPVGDSERNEMAGFATVSATKAFRKNYKQFNQLARQAHTPKISLRRTALEGLCPPRDPPTCPAASGRYRTHDGTCNNRRHPRWGSAQMPFNRFLPPEYEDGVDSIRNSIEGGSLSSSRFVSLVVHGAKDGEAPLTLMLAMWGQLLDHDMTSTAQPRSINGSVPSCCGRKDFHPSCFPIKVPLDDPWLAPLKVRCLEFLRSAPAQRRDCVLSWREQTNQATSYIDASPIYSNNAKTSDNARVFRNGLLVFGRGNPAEDVCHRGAMASQCIRAGDGRSGEQPGLLALHHVWVGEHNRIAMELSEMNAHWSDEKLYQETRRIVGAMFQHITYREFLPIILGKEVCKLFDLDLVATGYYDGYNSKVNPTVANSFAAAAFRFGHSLVQNSYMRCDRNHNILSNNVSLHEEFQRGDIGSAGSLHRLLRGLATQRTLKRDEFITPELTNHLFQTPGFPFGLDLAAINIQRGRDHGVPPYTAWRIPCGLTPINNWDELANVVGPESAQRIGHAYRNVHDIDLFVGGIAERPVVGGLVGPTFACIIAQQFSNSRKGDRFWYENGGFENSFTPAQLHAIRRVSLAQVLCRSVAGGTFQPHIFIPAGFAGNERLPCGVGPLTPIELAPWLEQDPFSTPTLAQSSLEPQIPERIFDIIPTSDISSDIINSVQIIKENKSEFSNRLPISGPNPASISNDFQTSANITNINDKLDIRRKRPTQLRKTTLRPFVGVHNKLDKGTKNSQQIKHTHQQRHRIQTTTRRTVIVHNIPIELRNANTGNVKTKKTDSQTKLQTNTDRTALKTQALTNSTIAPEPRAEDNELQGLQQTDKSLLSTNVSFANNVSVSFSNDLVSTVQNTTNITNSNFTDFRRNTSKLIDRENIDVNPLSQDISIATFNDDKTLDIEPLQHSTGEDHKRVQRQLTDGVQNTGQNSKLENVKNVEIRTSTRKQLRTTRSSSKYKTTPIPKLHNLSTISLLNFPPMSTSTPSTTSSTILTLKLTPTTKVPKLTKSSKTTQRNVELRQYQSRPTYEFTKPHKVILDGPNADQYEIEINIRQSNKLSSRPINSYLEHTYPDHTDVYKPQAYGYDRYSPHYVDYITTSSPAYATSILQTKRTKPPTIIYINEHEERTTTKQPNVFQNFISFATNGIVGGGARPHPHPHPISTQKEKPEHIINGQSVLAHSPHGSSVTSSTLQFASRPQTAYPVSSSTFTQVGGGGAAAQASSSAISTGNYGAIVGIASSNGADSTFSFNIRPKPNVIHSQSVNVLPAPKPHSGTYGFLSPPKPVYSQNPSSDYSHLPLSTSHTDSSYDLVPNQNTNLNSPFSTVHIRPQAQNYYGRIHASVQQKNVVNSDISSTFNQNTVKPNSHDSHDYDYQSRTIGMAGNLTDGNTETNTATATASVSDSSEDIDIDINYDYEDISEESSNEDVSLSKKYDSDGYLRPEHMIGNTYKSIEQSLIKRKNSTFDDNYVLPALNRTHFPLRRKPSTDELLVTFLNETNSNANFEDVLGKHSHNDILAEDDEDESLEQFIASKTEAISEITKSQNKLTADKQKMQKDKFVAFAPIKVLTSPERPDNWVIFDLPKERPQLPELPEIPDLIPHSMAATEVPMPIKSHMHLSWNNLQSKQPEISPKSTHEITENNTDSFSSQPTTKDTTLMTSHDDLFEAATKLQISDVGQLPSPVEKKPDKNVKV